MEDFGHGPPLAEESGDPTFAIVVPCYNYARFLQAAVNSVLSQDVRLKLLIVDDHSSDETERVGRDIAEGDGRVVFIRHRENKGHIHTYNEGIEWAEGELFSILSADDLLAPGALKRAARFMMRDPRLGMMYGRALYFDGDASDEAISTINASDQSKEDNEDDICILDAETFYQMNIDANIVQACSVVTRTSLQKQLGGYCPELPHAGDYEMWLRFAAHALVGYVPRFQVASRMHPRNMSKSYDLANDIRQRLCALDVLSKTCADLLPDSYSALRTRLAKQALHATWRSNAAGNLSEARSLIAMANQLDPTLRSNIISMKCEISHIIGPNIWNKVREIKKYSSSKIFNTDNTP